ncbi:P-loop containing nucleoside triphosphate hydrolase protein [Polychytrium aggregatum]|uniref:P-loop containing nucleoside triphosphate hydrolase protein n=1 Tax=Polychytrium aggregatum TaxID=110093 RepID=UPI0022FE52A2|nr:P-loop containing nucleoside triphosphate hydrolase protein [Polychytrium aggregatum]KAI9208556.1 P-loop containing nucleoside triphosphate hydrolase protein [Polychytrium aggregatum]
MASEDSGWGKAPTAASSWSAPPELTPIDPAKQNAAVEQLANKVEELSTTASAEDEPEVPSRPKHSGLVEDSGEHQVEVSLADGDQSVLYTAVSSFEDLGLNPNLLKGIYGMGFQKPSRIQEKALPLLLSNPPKNMIGQSQSGTGKTAAFVLSMLSRVNFDLKSPQAICLAPARELAGQIMDNLTQMGKFTGVTTAYAVKDSIPKGQKVDAQIVVGTPGTLLDLIQKRMVDLKNVKIFVLDEADNMLDGQGLQEQSLKAKNFVVRASPSCQIVLFSATFNDQIRSFANRFAPNANSISLKREELSVDGIKQFYMDCKNENHKAEVLCAIYGLLTIGQSIIFVNRRDVAERLERMMVSQGHTVTCLHGQHMPQERDRIMDDFRSGKCKVLITTNVIARGIDILQVNLVINYDIPLLGTSPQPDFETYLHRIGRTGRFGRTGVSINFCHDQKSYDQMMKISNHFGREITRVPTDDYMEVEKILKKAVK